MSRIFPLGDLTRDQSEALQGTYGDPGDTNRYVVDSDPRLLDATQLTSGLMSAADKTILDGLGGVYAANSRQVIAGDGLTGGGDLSADRTFNIAAADGSITVNADSIQVGVISDTQHGSRSGGSLHSVATTSVAGFLSATDKTKLDGIAAGATNTPLATTAPVNVTKAAAAIGTSSEAAKADHKHDIATATAASVGTANSEGTSASLSRADHVHSGLTRGANDFNTFTAKTVPAGADILLIEDSAASGVKKYASVAELLSTTGTGSLTTATYSQYATPANPGTTYVTFHSFTTPSVPSGSYRFAWSYEYNSSSTSTSFDGNIYIDGTSYQALSVTPRSSSDTLANSGFKYLTFGSSGTHTIRLDIKRTGTGTVTCNRVDFEFWKINL